MTPRPTLAQFSAHQKLNPHSKSNPLRDVILGGQDGLVNALGIILGFIAASSNIHVLIATVLAASFAESLSMGAVAYTSSLSQQDYYQSEKNKEFREIKDTPEMEEEEIRRIYQNKGFKGMTLEKIVKTISSNQDVWVNLMMSEELNLETINTTAVLKSSIIVTIATLIGHLIPLTPFLFLDLHLGVTLSLVISVITLFAVGVYQALTLVGSWWKSGIRMVIIGLGAAIIGYGIASLFHLSGL